MAQVKLVVGTLLGSGAYGSVYKADWGDRGVAIKKFNLTMDQVKSDQAIKREIELHRHLKDRHLIQFYGTLYDGGKLVFATDLAEGGNLQGAIERGKLDWSAKTRIFQEIAQGLTFLHQENVLHRDLKSTNVLLTEYMDVKLCDFGLPTIKASSASAAAAGIQAAKGTFRWMAPELFDNKPKYSKKSDIYALGMVMWEMAATCTVPFKSHADYSAVKLQVKSGKREVLPNTTPVNYRKWVELCWNQDPEKRPEAREMIIRDDVSIPVLQDAGPGSGSTLSISLLS